MIKAIATDMDGTFLNSQSEYDQERFLRVFDQLQARGIQFIVASGNPVYQLQRTFAPVADQLVYVAENGVALVEGDRDILVGEMQPQTVERLVALAETIPDSHLILSGRHQAYGVGEFPADFAKMIDRHYPDFITIHDLAEVADPIIKMVLEVPGELTETLMAKINHDFAGELTAVSSGYGNLDLIVAGMDKAAGLKRYLTAHDLTPDQLMAFGDGQNDLSMLRLAGESYAMANGAEIVKQTAKHLAKTNDESGVLAAIEDYLAHEGV